MYMKFLVMRRDIIKSRRQTNSIQSSCFPIEVEYKTEPGAEVDYEVVLCKALDTFSPNYRPRNREFVIIPMYEAKTISFGPPPPVIETHIDDYMR